MLDPLGVGGDLPPGQESTPLLVEDGTFPTNEPYLLADEKSLITPIPAFVTESDTYMASDGSLQSSWGAPAPYFPPLDRDTPINGVTHLGVPVTYNGAYVTHG